MSHKNIEVINAVCPPNGHLRLIDIAFMSICLSNLLSLVGPTIGLTGYSAWISALIAVFIGFLYCLPTVFITSALRSNSGMYSFVAAFLGPRMAGIYGVSNLADISISLIAITVGTYIHDVFPVVDSRVAGIVFMAAIFLLNEMGLAKAVKGQRIMQFLLFLTLTMYVFSGLLKNDLSPAFDLRGQEFMIDGTHGLFAAAVTMYFATTSYGMAMSYGVESKNAKKDIPIAMTLSAVILAVICSLMTLITSTSMPIKEIAGQPLTVAARILLPGILYILFVIFGPCMSLSTTCNASFSYYGLLIGDVADDGWLPPVFRKRNRYGARTGINTWYLLVGLIPLVLGMDISGMVNMINMLWAIISIISSLSLYFFPKRFPEEWKEARLHVPNWIYYIVCSLRFAVNTCILVSSALSISTAAVIAGVTLFAGLVAFTLWRIGHADDLKIHMSVWG